MMVRWLLGSQVHFNVFSAAFEGKSGVNTEQLAKFFSYLLVFPVIVRLLFTSSGYEGVN